MKKVSLLFVCTVLLGIMIGFSAGTYTIHLTPYYSGAYSYIPPSGAFINGHKISANEEINLSTIPPKALKSYPQVKDALYGSFKLAGKDIYVMVSNENGALKIFLSKTGANFIDKCDNVRIGLNTFHTPSLSNYETLVNVHVKHNGVEYTYPIILLLSVKSGKVLPTMYYWTASFMQGRIKINGKLHNIILGNLSGEGDYSDESADAISVDSLNFVNSKNIFYPANSLVLDGMKYDVISISPAGTEMVIKSTNEKVEENSLTVGKVFPNLNMTFLDGTRASLSSFKNDVVILYVWKIPYNFALQGPNITIKDTMLNTLEKVYNTYKAKDLKVIIAPLRYNLGDQDSWFGKWDDKAVEEMMSYNGFDFEVLTLKSAQSIVKELGLDSYLTHAYILGKKNVLLLKSPLMVRNIFQSFNAVSVSQEQILNFVDSLF